MVDFTLNHKRTLLGGLSFSQWLPSASGLAFLRGFASFNTYISYSMFNDRLKINLNASDLFNQSTITQKTYYNDYRYIGKFFFDPRCVELSVSYYFGKKKVHEVYRQENDVLHGRDN